MTPTRFLLMLTSTLVMFGYTVSAQTTDFLSGQVTIGPIKRGASYSAEGVTHVAQVLGDGTRIDRRVTIKVYRDREGRVRREQEVIGLPALTASEPAQKIVMLVDPVDGATYTFNQIEALAYRAKFDPVLYGGPAPASDPSSPGLPGSADNLSTSLQRDRVQLLRSQMQLLRQGISSRTEHLIPRFVAGLEASGTKTTIIIPKGRIGNDRPIEITHELWESPTLGLVLRYHHHDPTVGDVDYELTKITRGDPLPSLFVVPSNYKIVDY